MMTYISNIGTCATSGLVLVTLHFDIGKLSLCKMIAKKLYVCNCNKNFILSKTVQY